MSECHNVEEPLKFHTFSPGIFFNFNGGGTSGGCSAGRNRDSRNVGAPESLITRLNRKRACGKSHGTRLLNFFVHLSLVPQMQDFTSLSVQS